MSITKKCVVGIFQINRKHGVFVNIFKTTLDFNIQRMNAHTLPIYIPYMRNSFCLLADILQLHDYLHGNLSIKGYLDIHIKCNQCNKTFSEKSKLHKHLLIHTGEEPYKYRQFDKAFHQKSFLELHVRTQTQW